MKSCRPHHTDWWGSAVRQKSTEKQAHGAILGQHLSLPSPPQVTTAASMTAACMPTLLLTYRPSNPVRGRYLAHRIVPPWHVRDFRRLQGGRRRAQQNIVVNMHGSELLLPPERTFGAYNPSNPDPRRARAHPFFFLQRLADRLVAWCVCGRTSTSRWSRTTCPSSAASFRGSVRCVPTLVPAPTAPRTRAPSSGMSPEPPPEQP